MLRIQCRDFSLPVTSALEFFLWDSGSSSTIRLFQPPVCTCRADRSTTGIVSSPFVRSLSCQRYPGRGYQYSGVNLYCEYLSPENMTSCWSRDRKADLRRQRSILHGVFQICLGLKFMAFLVKMHVPNFKGPVLTQGISASCCLSPQTIRNWSGKSLWKLGSKKTCHDFAYLEYMLRELVVLNLMSETKYSGFKGGENHPGIWQL